MYDSELHHPSNEIETDGEEYGVENLINDLESASSNSEEDNVDEFDISNIDDMQIESSSELRNKYAAADFVNFIESEGEQYLEPIFDDDLESISEEPNVEYKDVGVDFSIINELEIKNKSIRLDLWLNRCVDSEFISMFLKYKNFSVENEYESPIPEIISHFELEEILEYKYKLNEDDFKNVLMKFFLPMGVINLVDIAKKYNTSISLTKDGLIKNFLNTYSPYEVIKILDKEGLDIVPFLDIPILEQIYLLNDSKLEEISKNLCPYEDSTKIGMMSCIAKYYDEGFLLSHNKLERVN